jgi:hypothetical protein
VGDYTAVGTASTTDPVVIAGVLEGPNTIIGIKARKDILKITLPGNEYSGYIIVYC